MARLACSLKELQPLAVAFDMERSRACRLAASTCFPHRHQGLVLLDHSSWADMCACLRSQSRGWTALGGPTHRTVLHCHHQIGCWSGLLLVAEICAIKDLMTRPLLHGRCYWIVFRSYQCVLLLSREQSWQPTHSISTLSSVAAVCRVMCCHHIASTNTTSLLRGVALAFAQMSRRIGAA